MLIETVTFDGYFWLVLNKKNEVFELKSAYKIHPKTKQIFGKDVSDFLYHYHKTDTYIRHLKNKFHHFYKVSLN